MYILIWMLILFYIITHWFFLLLLYQECILNVCIKGRPIYCRYIMRGSRRWVCALLLEKFKFIKITVNYSKHNYPSEISRKYSESAHVSMITKNHLIWTWYIFWLYYLIYEKPILFTWMCFDLNLLCVQVVCVL